MIIVNWITVIVLLGAAQGIFLSIGLFFIQSQNKTANRLLSLFILSVSLALIGRLELEMGVFNVHPELFLFQDIVLFLFGPLLYLYIRQLLDLSFKLNRIHLLLFLPAIVHVLMMSYTVFLSVKEIQEIFYMDPTYWLIVEGLGVFHNFVYIVINIFVYKKYTKTISTFISFSQKTTHLIVILAFVLSATALWMFLYLSRIIGITHTINYEFYRLIWLVLSLFSYFLGYFGLFFPNIFRVPFVQEKKTKFTENENELYEMKNRLNKLMETQKLFLNSGLTLQILAEKSEINRNTLSWVINKGFDKNFYDFVNEFRIEEFKRLVENKIPEEQTILSIALEAGFQSKTTFNVAFKKITGMTPKEYIRSKS